MLYFHQYFQTPLDSGGTRSYVIAKHLISLGHEVKMVYLNTDRAGNDFKDDYHSYKGNAYGLANTLAQTANLKPKIINKKVSNLFYTGQLTVPGPGVPPSLISGKIVADYIIKTNK